MKTFLVSVLLVSVLMVAIAVTEPVRRLIISNKARLVILSLKSEMICPIDLLSHLNKQINSKD